MTSNRTELIKLNRKIAKVSTGTIMILGILIIIPKNMQDLPYFDAAILIVFAAFLIFAVRFIAFKHRRLAATVREERISTANTGVVSETCYISVAQSKPETEHS